MLSENGREYWNRSVSPESKVVMKVGTEADCEDLRGVEEGGSPAGRGNRRTNTMSTDVQGKTHLKILLVDDDALSLAVMSLLLGAEGHEVITAECGDTALRLLATTDAAEAPNVLLVDMQMPGMSGRRLAAQLKKMVGPESVLLAMSATPNMTPAGYDDFLLKPLDVKALEAAAIRRPAQRPQISAPRAQTNDSVALDPVIYGNLVRAIPASAVAEVYAACVDDTRRRVPEMRVWADGEDMAKVRRTAHAIKGGAGMVGAVKLARLAEYLESGSYRSNELNNMLDELLVMCDEVERILGNQRNI
jgi:CheY-like chemotaxis protein/HPt (histidine-containing phosphotransfer) domain-containing protein